MIAKDRKSRLPAASKKKRARFQNPEEYLARLTEEKRGALEKLRGDIQSAAPDAEECISYDLPAFRLNGKLLVAYGAAAKHCAFYPGSTLQAFAKELDSYDTSKGTIRFSPTKPLPRRLVQKLVKHRVATHCS